MRVSDSWPLGSDVVRTRLSLAVASNAYTVSARAGVAVPAVVVARGSAVAAVASSSRKSKLRAVLVLLLNSSVYCPLASWISGLPP